MPKKADAAEAAAAPSAAVQKGAEKSPKKASKKVDTPRKGARVARRCTVGEVTPRSVGPAAYQTALSRAQAPCPLP